MTRHFKAAVKGVRGDRGAIRIPPAPRKRRKISDKEVRDFFKWARLLLDI